MERCVKLDAGLSQAGLREVGRSLSRSTTGQLVTGVPTTDLDLDPIARVHMLNAKDPKAGG